MYVDAQTVDINLIRVLATDSCTVNGGLRQLLATNIRVSMSSPLIHIIANS